MRKRYLLFMFVFLFICVGRVNAYDCAYFSDGGWGWQYRVNYHVDGDKISFDHGHTQVYSVLDFGLSQTYENKTDDEKVKALVDYMDGRCQKSVYVCEGHAGSNENYVSVLFDLQYEFQAKSYKGYAFTFLDSSYSESVVSYDGDNHCFSVPIYEADSNGEIVDSISSTCYNYVNYINEIKSNFPKCEKNDVQSCYTFNTVKSKLKTLCSSTVSYGSFNNPCVVSCLGLEEELANIENSDIDPGTCNVSDKILKLIKNVFKWGKYIAPVLVIILSILDFIKALAAQNDDEMKKAQGRFVKRLISAALLFIIPFLIEFALDTFHLVSDNPYCDII